MNTAGAKLFEDVAELASPPDGNDVAVLAFGDREAEGERAFGGVSPALPERRGGQELTLAVLDGHGRALGDVGVSVRSLARCSVRRDTVGARTVREAEDP